MGFNKFLFFETKRIFNIRKSLILLVFLLLTVYFIQTGISQYKDNLREEEPFKEFEKIRVENFQFYAQYGTYGFRLLFIPGSLSGLSSNAGIIHTNLNAFIDSGERVKIYESLRGKNTFINYTSVFMNLTGFILLFYSLLVLFYGLESYSNYDFLKFLEFKASRKKLFLFVFFSRLFLLFAWCLLIFLTALLLFVINGVTGIDIGMLALYFLITFLMLLFFLLVGMIAGTFDKKLSKFATVFAAWLLFVFFVPAVVSKIVYNRAESIISTYKMDIEKFKVMMNIEKKALEQAGKLNVQNINKKIRQQLHEYFWNNEFKTIFGYEQSMIKEMKEVVSLHYKLSLFFPTSFFYSANNEIAGCGYESLITFYDHVYKLKVGFVQYYAEKNFYLDEKKVKPYLKDGENIFYAKSNLPNYFDFGFIFSLFWAFLLLLILWIRFNRMLDYIPKIKTDHELNLSAIKKNLTNVVITSDRGPYPKLLYKLRRQNTAFAAIPKPNHLPGDLKVKDILSFFGLTVPEKLEQKSGKYIFTLELDEKALILLEVIRPLLDKPDIIVFDNFMSDLSDDCIDEFCALLKSKRKTMVYFTKSIQASTKIADYVHKFPKERQSY